MPLAPVAAWADLGCLSRGISMTDIARPATTALRTDRRCQRALKRMVRSVWRRLCVVVLAAALAVSCGWGGGTPVREDGGVIIVGDTDVFAVERDVITAPVEGGPTVLFLHGASFTADVWATTGILDAMSEAGYRSVAVDLPGFGRTPAISTDRGQFLAQLVAIVSTSDTRNAAERQTSDTANSVEAGVVVISPSMSGSFSLPMIADGRPDALRGFVPVAPVGIRDLMDPSTESDVPTMIVWGSEDAVIPVDEARMLGSMFPNSSVNVIDGGGHAAYRTNPDAFTRLLLDFLATL